MWGLWDGGEALMNGISILIKENPWELTCSFYYVSTQQKDGCLWTRKQALMRHWICQHLESSQLLELLEINTCLPRSLKYSVIIGQMDSDI